MYISSRTELTDYRTPETRESRPDMGTASAPLLMIDAFLQHGLSAIIGVR